MVQHDNYRNPIFTSSWYLPYHWDKLPFIFLLLFLLHIINPQLVGLAVLPLGGLGGSNTCASLSNTSFRNIGAPFPGIGLRFAPWLDKTG